MSEPEGMTCVVTGASSGIGRAAAEALAHAGMRVVMVCRSRERGRHAMMEIMRDTGSSDVDLLLADLSSQADVRRVALEIAGRFPHVDVLVNNAGAIFRKRQESVDGLEMTFALNHLGYFLLTTELLETLRSSAPCRIINVASSAHRYARLDLEDLQLTRRYSARLAYGNSKLCNLLFTAELSRRLEGSGVTVNAMHPGNVATRFGSNNDGFMRHMMTLGRPFLRTPARGAHTIFHLATSEAVEGESGSYWVDDRVRTSSRASRDPELAARLWEASERLTGQAP